MVVKKKTAKKTTKKATKKKLNIVNSGKKPMVCEYC